MGNATDCSYCNNYGKPWSFGCPKCKRYDARPEHDKKYDRDMRQYEINREVAGRAIENKLS